MPQGWAKDRLIERESTDWHSRWSLIDVLECSNVAFVMSVKLYLGFFLKIYLSLFFLFFYNPRFPRARLWYADCLCTSDSILQRHHCVCVLLPVCVLYEWVTMEDMRKRMEYWQLYHSKEGRKWHLGIHLPEWNLPEWNTLQWNPTKWIFHEHHPSSSSQWGVF